jgi:hypothetical protein
MTPLRRESFSGAIPPESRTATSNQTIQAVITK